MDGIAWSAAALVTHPETVRSVHEDYLRAGAEVLIANSFATSRHVLTAAGLGDRVQELNRRSIELAKEAVGRAALDRPVWIAGSISRFVPSGDNQQRPTPAEERASYREQAELARRRWCGPAGAGDDPRHRPGLRDRRSGRNGQPADHGRLHLS